MPIARGTTPAFVLRFPEKIDMADVREVYVTFKHGNVKVTKSGSDIQVTHGEISVRLSQSETLLLGCGTIEIQVNWTFGSGLRAASSIATCEFTRQLLPEVLE